MERDSRINRRVLVICDGTPGPNIAALLAAELGEPETIVIVEGVTDMMNDRLEENLWPRRYPIFRAEKLYDMSDLFKSGPRIYKDREIVSVKGSTMTYPGQKIQKGRNRR